MSFESMLALRYLRPRRGEGFVSLITLFAFCGIALGVATLIIVMSVMNGFRAELMERILGIDGHLALYRSGDTIQDYQGIRDRVAQVDGVQSIMPLVEGQVIASFSRRNSGAVVRGMIPADFSGRDFLADSIVAGSLDSFAGDSFAGGGSSADSFSLGKGIVIGDRLAQRLGVGVGDKVTLVSPQLGETIFGGMPRLKAFPVAAIFDIGMYQYDGHFIFMPMAWAQRFLGLQDRVHVIEITLAEERNIDALIPEIKKAAGEDLFLRDWRRHNEVFFNALEVERNVMFLILTLMILVAAFNIITGSIMLVKDKLRSIAILRTIGARRGSILRVFVWHGALIGFSATFLGLLAGVSFALNIEGIRTWVESTFDARLFAEEIYFLSKLPSRVEFSDVGIIAALSLVLSLLATLYPAWRASRVDPVQTLRYA